ncbi:hypothetical protein [Streptomyces sp. NPDC051684]|uniref:hypothetical protein n=1 Tax=Streptomyces sp. NPDC051684 TaxID=3365670 RepID=UPI0037B16B8E
MTTNQEPTAFPPMPDGPPPSAPVRRARGRLLLAGLAGAFLGAGAVGAVWAGIVADRPGEPETFTMTGTFELSDAESVVSDGVGGCAGGEGYDDIAEGSSVTVYGAGGDVIATGSLGASQGTAGTPCTFEVTIDDVPKREKFYKVEVSNRGTVQLSADEAETGQLAATLG